MPPRQRAKPLRERPKLLVDLSEKVSEDLRIVTPPRSLTAAPSLSAAPRPKAGHLTASSLAAAGLGVGTTRAASTRAARRVAFRPPAQLARSIKAMIRKVVPGDGEVVYALDFPDRFRVGDIWKNYNEIPFWLGSDRHLDRDIDEHLNAEYEHICTMFDEPIDVDFKWGVNESLDVSSEMLYDAWDHVAHENPSTLFKVHVLDADGQATYRTEEVSAQDLMDYFNVGLEMLFPLIVVADVVLETDLDRIEHDDDYIYLDGYVVDRVTEDGYLMTVHIVPPTQ